jgi:integrase
MYLFKRPNGIWYTWEWENDRRIWRSTHQRSKSDALRYLCAEKPKQGIRWSDFKRSFLYIVKTTRAPRTYEMYKSVLDYFSDIVSTKTITEITTEDVLAWVWRRQKDGLNATSLHMQYRTIKAAFNYAIRKEYRVTNPCLRGLLKDPPQKRRVYFSPDEVKRILSNSKGWFADFCLFALLTGMRRGEILNLRWIDITPDYILIQSSEVYTTKSGKTRRIFYTPQLREILERRRTKSDYCFTTQGIKINQRTISKKFQAVCTKAKITGKTFYTFRHTFATWLLQSGEELTKIRDAMGHSSVKTTEIYLHLAFDYSKSAFEKMGNIVSALPKKHRRTTISKLK